MPYETIGGGQNYGAEVENDNVPLVDWSQVVNEAMAAMPRFPEEETEADGAAFDSAGEFAAAEGGEMAQAEAGHDGVEGDATGIEAADDEDDENDEGGEDAVEVKAEKAEDREGKIKRIFEKVRGRLGFRKVVTKVKKKLAQAVVGAVAWAENALKEDEEGETAETEKVTEAGDEAEAETEDAAEMEDVTEAEDVTETEGAADATETADVTETPETEKAPEMERGEKLRQLGLVKAEVERRVRTATDNEAQMRWIIVAKEIDDKIIQLRVDEERERIAAENAFQPYEAVDFAGKFGIEKLKTDGVIPQDMEPTLEEMRALEKDVDGKIFAAVRDGDEIAENHYRSQMEYIQMAARGLAQEQAKAETEAKTEMVEEVETEKAA